jgi:hypothetical protein
MRLSRAFLKIFIIFILRQKADEKAAFSLGKYREKRKNGINLTPFFLQ